MKIFPIQDVRNPFVLYMAGGGAELIGSYQTQSGCGERMLEAGVPYSREAVHDLTGQTLRSTLVGGRKMGGATSWEASFLLSGAAWARAGQLRPDLEKTGTLMGVGVTATLHGGAKPYPEEAYIVVRTGPSGQHVYREKLEGDAASRIIHDPWNYPGSLRARSSLVLAEHTHTKMVCQGEPEVRFPNPVSLPEGDVFFGAHDLTGRSVPNLSDRYLFGGSWNPLHHAHLQMKTQMDLHTGRNGVLVLSRNHPVKGPIDPERVRQFLNSVWGVADVLLSNDDGMFTSMLRWNAPLMVGTDVFAHVSDQDLEQIAPHLLLVSRPGTSPETMVRLGRMGLFPHMVSRDTMSSTFLRS